ncbi:SpoIIE family protein phosphatase [Streptomyces sp. NPDC050256]|uniref:SpoIIE family protein phosphatase n=1 Tax=Streptomyces sp. NPDC050256 TaxID=3365607 RepID=UPI003793E35F
MPSEPAEVLEPVLSQALRAVGARWGMVYLQQDNGGDLGLAVVAGAPRRKISMWARLGGAESTPIADCVRTRRLVRVRDREELARVYPQIALAFPYPFSMAAAPILTGARCWGALVLVWPGSRPSSADTEEDNEIPGACDRLGRLLSQAAAVGYPVVPSPEPLMSAVTGADLRGAGDVSAAVEFADRLPGGCIALDLACRVTFVTAGAAELLGVDPEKLLGLEPWRVLPWMGHPAFEDRYRAAVIGGEPTSFITVRPRGAALRVHLYPDATGVSLRVVPADTASSGPLNPPAPLGKPGRPTLLFHLMSAAASLTDAVGPEDVIRRVTDRIMPVFGYRGVAMMVTENGRLRTVASRGYPVSALAPLDAAAVTSDQPAGRAMITGEPEFFNDYTELSAAHPGTARRDGMAAWAFLPLMARARPVGLLLLAHDRPHAFEEEERAILSSLAGLIAQALDRAQLYDIKHRLARSLQEGLLPRTLPRVPGLEVAARYLPAAHGADVGGDFYDVVPSGGHCAVVIGDVEGHEMAAAAVMGQVRTAAHVLAGAPPDEVLSRTNRLMNVLETELFASCLYARIDLARDRIGLATAGHLPPLIRHPGGRTEILHLPPGLLLGIDPESEYVTTEHAFPPGSALALYTDGLVETPDTDIEEAVRGLATAFTDTGDDDAETTADRLVTHARRSIPGSDDIALLIVRRLP